MKELMKHLREIAISGYHIRLLLCVAEWFLLKCISWDLCITCSAKATKAELPTFVCPPPHAKYLSNVFIYVPNHKREGQERKVWSVCRVERRAQWDILIPQVEPNPLHMKP